MLYVRYVQRGTVIYALRYTVQRYKNIIEGELINTSSYTSA